MGLTGIDLARLSPAARAQTVKKLIEQAIRESPLRAQNDGRSKYGAEKTEAMGQRFDSKKEANRYAELLLMQRQGVIRNLRCQVPFELLPKQQKPSGGCERSVRYVADFVYDKDGVQVVEDAKGFRTKDYVIKRKLMLYVHGIEVREI